MISCIAKIAIISFFFTFLSCVAIFNELYSKVKVVLPRNTQLLDNENKLETLKINSENLIFSLDSSDSLKRQDPKEIKRKRGVFSDESDFSILVGLGYHNLGTFFLFPTYFKFGVKYYFNNDFDIIISASYRFSWLGNTDYFEYANPTYSFTGYHTELFYHPFKNNGIYFSFGVGITDYKITADSIKIQDKEIFQKDVFPLSLGIGYEWLAYSVDLSYSFAFPKIAPRHRGPYYLNYFTLGVNFYMPL